jgi:hypothetical protein
MCQRDAASCCGDNVDGVRSGYESPRHRFSLLDSAEGPLNPSAAVQSNSRSYEGEIRWPPLETSRRAVGRSPKRKPGETPTGEADARGHRHRIGIPAGEAPPDARKLNGGREGPVRHRPDYRPSRLFSGRRDTARTR